MTDEKKTAEITVPINIQPIENPPVVGTKVIQPNIEYHELSAMEKSMYDISIRMGADPRTITRESLNSFITRSLRNMASQYDVELSEQDLAEGILDSDIQELDRVDSKGNTIKYNSNIRHHRMSQELNDNLSKLTEGLLRVEQYLKQEPELS